MKTTILISSFLLAALIANAKTVKIDGIYYNLNNDGTAEVTSNPDLYSGELVIPKTVTSNNTTYVITSIGYSAFDGCKSLLSIDLPDKINRICDYAFRNSGIKSIVLPKGVNEISWGAFMECLELERVKLNEGLTIIDDNVFTKCESLDSIEFPSTLTIIRNRSFSACKSLKSVSIPKGVISIGQGAFFGCSNLTSITLPSTITEIGGNICYECDKLQIIKTFIMEPFSIRSPFSESIYKTATLYVPKGTKEKYKSIDFWDFFTNIIEMDETESSVKTLLNKSDNSIIYGLKGERKSNIQKGINIIKSERGKTIKILRR